MSEAQLRSEICRFGSRLYERGLVGACEGNLSVRLDAKRILVTPAGVCKGFLVPDSMAVMDLATGTVHGEGVASSEVRIHLAAYRRRPDCQAVVHAHPITATAYAVVHSDIPWDVLPEGAVVLGKVASVPFAMPGTDELPQALEPYLSEHKAFLFQNHGAMTLGRSLEDAFNRMETLERVAQVLFKARQLGEIQRLPDGVAQRLLNNEL